MADGPVMVDRNVGFAATDIDQDTAELFLVIRQNSFAHRDRFQDCIANQQAASINRSHNVLRGCG